MTDQNRADALALKAERLFVNAALMLTRLEPKMRRACRLVLVEKVPLSEAARRVGDHRQNVYRALRRVKPKLAQVKEYAGQQ